MRILTDRLKLTLQFICIDGKPISFNDYPTHLAFYKGGYPQMLLKCGRQTAKSTTAGNLILAESIGIPHFKTIYLNPYKDQTSRFSNTRLKKVIAFSPNLKMFFDASVKAHIFHKEVLNGSEIFMTYAQINADRARGIPADRAIFDEIQDIDYQSVMPVVLECLANSDYRYRTFLGTPKTLENPIEYLWDQSSQTEWCVKCFKCNSWTFFTTLDCIGEKGPLCMNPKCREYVNPRNGRWVNMRPEAKLKGFHLPQIILPRNFQEPYRWSDIYDKLSDPAYGEVTLLNEIMGISASRGARMISLEELRELANDGIDCFDNPIKDKNVVHRTGGVDWSGGGVSGVSRTAAWVYGLRRDNRLVCEWYKIFPNKNPVDSVHEIAQKFSALGVEMVGGDAGEGYTANQLLNKKMGVNKTIQLEWHNQSRPMKFNGVDKYTCDKTTMFDNYFLLMKRQGIILPKRPRGDLVIDDILNEFEETTASGKRVWKCNPSKSDDLLHAQIFAWIAMKIILGDMNFYEGI